MVEPSSTVIFSVTNLSEGRVRVPVMNSNQEFRLSLLIVEGAVEAFGPYFMHSGAYVHVVDASQPCCPLQPRVRKHGVCIDASFSNIECTMVCFVTTLLQRTERGAH